MSQTHEDFHTPYVRKVIPYGTRKSGFFGPIAIVDPQVDQGCRSRAPWAFDGDSGSRVKVSEKDGKVFGDFEIFEGREKTSKSSFVESFSHGFLIHATKVIPKHLKSAWRHVLLEIRGR